MCLFSRWPVNLPMKAILPTRVDRQGIFTMLSLFYTTFRLLTIKRRNINYVKIQSRPLIFLIFSIYEIIVAIKTLLFVKHIINSLNILNFANCALHVLVTVCIIRNINIKHFNIKLN